MPTKIPVTATRWAPCYRIIPSRFPPIGLFERVADLVRGDAAAVDLRPRRAELFEPATKDGVPVPYTLSFTYRFRLRQAIRSIEAADTTTNLRDAMLVARSLSPDNPDIAPTDVWFRYHIRLVNWNAASTGKLPGLAGIYSSSARGCIRPSESQRGWSARIPIPSMTSRRAKDGSWSTTSSDAVTTSTRFGATDAGASSVSTRRDPGPLGSASSVDTST